MLPLKPIKAYLKKVFSDLHSVLIGIVLTAILSGGGIYLFFRNLWTQLKNIVQSPTPLWAAIALTSICCLYIYLKDLKNQPIQNTDVQSKKSPPYEIKYLTTEKYKWEVSVYKNGNFELNDYPICVEHNLKFIFGNRGKYCPHSGCRNNLSENEQFAVKETVKSLIDRNIRTGEWKS